MEELTVGLGERSYQITIGRGVRKCVAELPDRRNFIVTDSNVTKLWGAEISAMIPHDGIFILPAGEENKTPENVISICRHAAGLGFDRKSRFVALGGGVVGDMTGFAAAIYMRGIEFVQMPTTLLAMVDSSVGGKTGADLPEGKNLIGVFHQPSAVLIDPDFLTTLPPAEIRCGLAEVLKMGVILDEKLFAALENFTPSPDSLIPLIRRSCELKAEVVAKDEREGGLRAILNYGHTFGHAVELLSDFSINHGEGVAIGMCCAGVAAAENGYWSYADSERQKKVLAALGLPTAIPRAFRPEKMLEAMRLDKKNNRGAVTLILPAGIGSCRIVNDLGDEKILQTLEKMYD